MPWKVRYRFIEARWVDWWSRVRKIPPAAQQLVITRRSTERRLSRLRLQGFA
jgi:hypothetical protein